MKKITAIIMSILMAMAFTANTMSCPVQVSAAETPDSQYAVGDEDCDEEDIDDEDCDEGDIDDEDIDDEDFDDEDYDDEDYDEGDFDDEDFDYDDEDIDDEDYDDEDYDDEDIDDEDIDDEDYDEGDFDDEDYDFGDVFIDIEGEEYDYDFIDDEDEDFDEDSIEDDIIEDEDFGDDSEDPDDFWIYLDDMTCVNPIVGMAEFIGRSGGEEGAKHSRHDDQVDDSQPRHTTSEVGFVLPEPKTDHSKTGHAKANHTKADYSPYTQLYVLPTEMPTEMQAGYTDIWGIYTAVLWLFVPAAGATVTAGLHPAVGSDGLVSFNDASRAD